MNKDELQILKMGVDTAFLYLIDEVERETTTVLCDNENSYFFDKDTNESIEFEDAFGRIAKIEYDDYLADLEYGEKSHFEYTSFIEEAKKRGENNLIKDMKYFGFAQMFYTENVRTLTGFVYLTEADALTGIGKYKKQVPAGRYRIRKIGASLNLAYVLNYFKQIPI